MDCSLPGSSAHGDSTGKNTGVGCHALLQGIFPTQGWNPGRPCCRWILYCLSHQGSPRILEWVACPGDRGTGDREGSRGTSQPRNWIRASCIAGSFYQLSYQRSPSSSLSMECQKKASQKENEYFFPFLSFLRWGNTFVVLMHVFAFHSVKIITTPGCLCPERFFQKYLDKARANLPTHPFMNTWIIMMKNWLSAHNMPGK